MQITLRLPNISLSGFGAKAFYRNYLESLVICLTEVLETIGHGSPSCKGTVARGESRVLSS